MPRSFLGSLLFSWLENYDDVLNAAVSLLYAQLFVGLLGTLSDKATGVVDADVAVALFGLVAVASGYQTLGRTYAALLLCMLVLDACWLPLYAPKIWAEVSIAEKGWDLRRYPPALLLLSSGFGLLFRILSLVLWAQMFRLGWAATESYSMPFLGIFSDQDQSRAVMTPADQSPRFARQLSQMSHSSDFLGSSIFHPPSFAALVQPGGLNDYLGEDSVSYSRGSSESGYDPPARIPEEGEYTEDEEGTGDTRDKLDSTTLAWQSTGT